MPKRNRHAKYCAAFPPLHRRFFSFARKKVQVISNTGGMKKLMYCPCSVPSIPSPETLLHLLSASCRRQDIELIFCVCRHNTLTRTFSSVCSVERHWELLRCGQRQLQNVPFERSFSWYGVVYFLFRRRFLTGLRLFENLPAKSNVAAIRAVVSTADSTTGQGSLPGT